MRETIKWSVAFAVATLALVTQSRATEQMQWANNSSEDIEFPAGCGGGCQPCLDQCTITGPNAYCEDMGCDGCMYQLVGDKCSKELPPVCCKP